MRSSLQKFIKVEACVCRFSRYHIHLYRLSVRIEIVHIPFEGTISAYFVGSLI